MCQFAMRLLASSATLRTWVCVDAAFIRFTWVVRHYRASTKAGAEQAQVERFRVPLVVVEHVSCPAGQVGGARWTSSARRRSADCSAAPSRPLLPSKHAEIIRSCRPGESVLVQSASVNAELPVLCSAVLMTVVLPTSRSPIQLRVF